MCCHKKTGVTAPRFNQLHSEDPLFNCVTIPPAPLCSDEHIVLIKPVAKPQTRSDALRKLHLSVSRWQEIISQLLVKQNHLEEQQNRQCNKEEREREREQSQACNQAAPSQVSYAEQFITSEHSPDSPSTGQQQHELCWKHTAPYGYCLHRGSTLALPCLQMLLSWRSTCFQDAVDPEAHLFLALLCKQKKTSGQCTESRCFIKKEGI